MQASKMFSYTWPDTFSPSEWPDGTLEHMESKLFSYALFPIREQAGVPMWPSSLYGAHVRTEGTSRHSTQGGTRLSDATDVHVKTIEHMVHVMAVAENNVNVGGIGIYFDTNTPMIHIDTRPDRLLWLRTRNGEYVYRENNHSLFYKTLAEEIEWTTVTN